MTDRLTDEALAFIEEHRDRRFFLYLSHYTVHTPLEAPEALIEKYRDKQKRDSSQINPPTPPWWKRPTGASVALSGSWTSWV